MILGGICDVNDGFRKKEIIEVFLKYMHRFRLVLEDEIEDSYDILCFI